MAGTLDLIDSHKLIYHPRRVADWLEGKEIFPLYIEVGLIARCNHRCIFCAFDYLEYKGPFLSTDVLKSTLTDAALHGVKSVLFAGEGEPLLHHDISELITFTKSSGLDIALSTNGVLFNSRLAWECLESLSWIRFSLDAGTRGTYAKVHRCPEKDFETVLENINNVVRLKRVHSYNCSIGVQALLLPENLEEMISLGIMLKDMGVDYFTVKPFSKHPSSICDINLDYTNLLPLEEELSELNNDNFKVIFRTHTIKKLKEERPYKQCLGLPFITVIDSHGDVYTCNTFLGNKDFCYGNIYQNSFSEIWEGERRKEVVKMVAEMGVEKCREVCRLDEINRYLWKLKNPPEHVNFI